MTDIALKMLFGERAKYAMLVSGICFATILMTQGLAMFFGILSFSSRSQAPLGNALFRRSSASPPIAPGPMRSRYTIREPGGPYVFGSAGFQPVVFHRPEAGATDFFNPCSAPPYKRAAGR